MADLASRNLEWIYQLLFLLMTICGDHIGDATGLIGFNCTHSDATSSEFSLLHQLRCPDFDSISMDRTQHIQLLQRKEFRDIHAYSVKVTRTLHILPCDGDPVTHQLTQRVLTLSRREVEQVHASLSYADSWLADIAGAMKLRPNGTTLLNRNLKGWTHEEGYCGAAEFTLHGLTYKDAALAGQYDVLLRDGLATVDLANDLINTFGGTTCIYSDGFCSDITYGDIYWDTHAINLEECDEDTFVVLII